MLGPRSSLISCSCFRFEGVTSMKKRILLTFLLISMYGVTDISSTQSLPCHTASGDNCTSSICPNTVVTYTCTITSGTAAGLTDWTLPTGTCRNNTFFPDMIRLSQYVSNGDCSAQGETGVSSICGPYRAYSIRSSDPSYCLSSILTVNITAAMNGSTVTCCNTNNINSNSTVVSMATINVVGPPGAPKAVANTIDPGMVLVVVNPSSSGGLPTSYSITISNSYGYSNSKTVFPTNSATVTFTGLTNSTNYTISAVAINCAGSSNITRIYISWPTSNASAATGATTTPSPGTSDQTIIGPIVGGVVGGGGGLALIIVVIVVVVVVIWKTKSGKDKLNKNDSGIQLTPTANAEPQGQKIPENSQALQDQLVFVRNAIHQSKRKIAAHRDQAADEESSDYCAIQVKRPFCASYGRSDGRV